MIVWVDGDVLSIVTMKVSKIMVFRAFYMTRHSNWSSCSQSQRKNLPFDDAWTTRLERCLLVPSSPWALPNLSQGKKSCISGREKKIPPDVNRGNYDLSFNFRLLQLSPLLPLHHFFSVGKCFSEETQFLLLPTWTHPEWPWCCNHYTRVTNLQMTCLAGPSNWQLNTAGYGELQQRGHGEKTAQKAEVVHSPLPKFYLLSLPLSLEQVIPLLNHVLVIEFLISGLSPKW